MGTLCILQFPCMRISPFFLVADCRTLCSTQSRFADSKCSVLTPNVRCWPSALGAARVTTGFQNYFAQCGRRGKQVS